MLMLAVSGALIVYHNNAELRTIHNPPYDARSNVTNIQKAIVNFDQFGVLCQRLSNQLINCNLQLPWLLMLQPHTYAALYQTQP